MDLRREYLKPDTCKRVFHSEDNIYEYWQWRWDYICTREWSPKPARYLYLPYLLGVLHLWCPHLHEFLYLAQIFQYLYCNERRLTRAPWRHKKIEKSWYPSLLWQRNAWPAWCKKPLPMKTENDGSSVVSSLRISAKFCLFEFWKNKMDGSS